MTSVGFPLTFKALQVKQPLGIFYVAVIPACVLLEACYSHAAHAEVFGDGYRLEGNQRFTQDKRLSQIADYIARSDTAFPNALILAVDPVDDGEDPEEERQMAPTDGWQIGQDPNGDWTIRIPAKGRMAAVVDGQHRLFAFAKEAAAPHRDMPLLCSIYFDLPKPFQAQLFATINSTQKRVDKSLTYELFGYNVSDEAPESWTPEKLAVFLARRFNVQDNSPLNGRIMVAPKRGPDLDQLTRGVGWHVSTAVVVEGLMRLYSSNPKRDANAILASFTKKRRVLSKGAIDRSPMRSYYLNSDDFSIYNTTLYFLDACQDIFWSRANDRSFITKTVGLQALFDVLRKLVSQRDFAIPKSKVYFVEILSPAEDLDFSKDEFRSASGSGRSAIRNAILTALAL
ncbi:DGQHR domain-containing protein [Methylobacterium sp. Leaf123]|uniref:DGQHR domain-containing protein n=1 Tax=Methylobacterium sp. Leaf123 TaxID=1736264 RepID=UPI0009E8FBA3|nr:DGQHR domain-containing protein [Methylobacterium sp. Leaf123]